MFISSVFFLNQMYHFLFILLVSSFPSPPSFSSLFHPLLFLLDAQRAIRLFTLSFSDALPLRYVFSLNSQPSFVCAVPFPSSPTSAARFALSLSPPCAALIAAIRLGRGRGGGGGGWGGEENGMMEEQSGEKRGGLVMDENTRRHSNDSALFPN